MTNPIAKCQKIFETSEKNGGMTPKLLGSVHVHIFSLVLSDRYCTNSNVKCGLLSNNLCKENTESLETMQIWHVNHAHLIEYDNKSERTTRAGIFLMNHFALVTWSPVSVVGDDLVSHRIDEIMRA